MHETDSLLPHSILFIPDIQHDKQVSFCCIQLIKLISFDYTTKNCSTKNESKKTKKKLSNMLNLSMLDGNNNIFDFKRNPKRTENWEVIVIVFSLGKCSSKIVFTGSDLNEHCITILYSVIIYKFTKALQYEEFSKSMVSNGGSSIQEQDCSHSLYEECILDRYLLSKYSSS